MSNEFVRGLLNDWARWLCSSGGYAHQSSLEWFRQGGKSSIFGSKIPTDVEPTLAVSRTSRAMQHLRLLDAEAAGILTTLYLRKKDTRLLDLAKQAGLGMSTFQDRRRVAEVKLLNLWEAIGRIDLSIH